MGAICCPQAQEVGKLSSEVVETEKEISLSDYSSILDNEVKSLEKTYNLFGEMTFSDYIHLLSTFSLDNATVPVDLTNKAKKYHRTDPFFNESMSSDFFQSFIENKVFKHPNIYTKAGENELMSNIFKTTQLEMHKALKMKLNQHAKKDGKAKDDDIIKKSHCLGFGYLYTKGTNVFKIKTLFDLFSDNGQFVLNEEFKDFILSLFLLATSSIIAARVGVGKKHVEIGELKIEDQKKYIDACELKDSEHLVDLSDKLLNFQSGMNYDQFKEAFSRKAESAGWMISAKGIRSMQEIHNN